VGEALRYVGVSLAGFAVDFSVLALGVEILGLPLLTANAISFMCGMLVVYMGSVLWVFAARKFENKIAELLIFCGIGLVGLMVNQSAMWFGTTALLLPYGLAKIGAAGASFASNFIMRKVALF
jgi:putative flippase GtrA